MSNDIISAFILGLIGGLIPGPVLAATFTEILQSGFLKSMRIILWALLIETIVALISMVILSSLNLPEYVFRIISIAGAGILLWISFSIWKVKKIDSGEKAFFSIWKISTMILANGMLWTYWITVCVPRAIILQEKIFMGDYIFLGLVQIGWLLSTIIVALIFSQFRKLLSHPRAIPIIFKVFSLIFMYFAIETIVKTIMFFIK
jgi:threonine/homoserine/homoserine lactone efflux protein